MFNLGHARFAFGPGGSQHLFVPMVLNVALIFECVSEGSDPAGRNISILHGRTFDYELK